MNQMPEDIRERSFRFAVRIINASERLPLTRSGNLLAKQLIRSGTSIGANAQEALSSDSRKDFAFKNSIALREARETRYWLRLIASTIPEVKLPFEELLRESDEITRIFGAIVSKTRGKSKRTA